MPEQRLLSIKDFGRQFGPGKSTTYELIHSGELEIVKVGTRSFIPVEIAEAWRQRRMKAAGIYADTRDEYGDGPRLIGDILVSAITELIPDPDIRKPLVTIVSGLPSAPSSSFFEAIYHSLGDRDE